MTDEDLQLIEEAIDFTDLSFVIPFKNSTLHGTLGPKEAAWARKTAVEYVLRNISKRKSARLLKNHGAEDLETLVQEVYEKGKTKWNLKF